MADLKFAIAGFPIQQQQTLHRILSHAPPFECSFLLLKRIRLTMMHDEPFHLGRTMIACWRGYPVLEED